MPPETVTDTLPSEPPQVGSMALVVGEIGAGSKIVTDSTIAQPPASVMVTLKVPAHKPLAVALI